MSVTLTTLRTGIVSALAAVNGSSPYTITLSGSDQVVQGARVRPPRSGVPCVALTGWRMESQRGEQMGRYTRTVTWSLLGWAPTSTDNVGAKNAALENMANDITIALERAVRLSGGALFGTVYDVQVTALEEVEISTDAAGYVGFVMSVEFYYRSAVTGGL